MSDTEHTNSVGAPSPGRANDGPDLVVTALLVVGPLLLAIGVVLLVWNWVFLSNAVPARGTVVNLIEVRSSDGDINFKPEIRYPVPGGETFTRTTTWATNPPFYNVGDTVDVLYDPADPGTMVPDGFWSKWLTTLLFLGVGNIFTIAGLWQARRADAGAGEVRLT